jgi:hypothetical protein
VAGSAALRDSGLAAAPIADSTPKSDRARLAAMTDEELMEAIVNSQEAAELVKQGVKTEEELPDSVIVGTQPQALSRSAATQGSCVLPSDEELLR